MCGRFCLTNSGQIDFARLGVREPVRLPESYNIAPGRSVAIVREHPQRGGREVVAARWGLLPHWCEDPATSYINAWSESAHTRPAFRTALAHRRCLILADGYYEWVKTRGKKQPYFISMKNGRPFAFAGIWECWRAKQHILRSCAMLTTTSNRLLANLHERMPVILHPRDYDLWLDSRIHDPRRLQRAMRRWPGNQMKATPVSTHVNDPHHDDPACIEPRSEFSIAVGQVEPGRGYVQPLFAIMDG